MLEGTSQNIQDIGAQAREVSQAMVERVDKVEGQMMSIRSTLKKEAYVAVALDHNHSPLGNQRSGSGNPRWSAKDGGSH